MGSQVEERHIRSFRKRQILAKSKLQFSFSIDELFLKCMSILSNRFCTRWNSESNVSKQFRDRVEGDGPENGNSNDIAMASSRTRKQVRINLIDPSGKVTEGRIDYSVEGTESENVRSKKNTSCVHYF